MKDVDNGTAIKDKEMHRLKKWSISVGKKNRRINQDQSSSIPRSWRTLRTHWERQSFHSQEREDQNSTMDLQRISLHVRLGRERQEPSTPVKIEQRCCLAVPEAFGSVERSSDSPCHSSNEYSAGHCARSYSVCSRRSMDDDRLFLVDCSPDEKSRDGQERILQRHTENYDDHLYRSYRYFSFDTTLCSVSTWTWLAAVLWMNQSDRSMDRTVSLVVWFLSAVARTHREHRDVCHRMFALCTEVRFEAVWFSSRPGAVGEALGWPAGYERRWGRSALVIRGSWMSRKDQQWSMTSFRLHRRYLSWLTKDGSVVRRPVSMNETSPTRSSRRDHCWLIVA